MNLIAFPEQGLSGLPNGDFIQGRSGMDLRDYFAAKALVAEISRPEYNSSQAFAAAKESYFLADAMLEARK